MGQVYESIDEKLSDFIQRQKMFFVATAPLAENGKINLSPKGLDSFRILDPKTVAYLDLAGSGIETVAHLRENGRICVMFCAFEGPPKILRLHGKGEVFEPGEKGYNELARQLPENAGARTVVKIHIERIADSCGWGVPLYAHEGERHQYQRYTASLSPEKRHEYKVKKNSRSIDGLPGLAHLDLTSPLG